jgi:flagellar hook-associated protein 1 FlgK
MAISLGLNTATKALRAQQLAVDIASHNIANAQTPGFSRQRVILRAEGITSADRNGHDDLLGKAGFGVSAADVNRVRDTFLDFQARQTNSAMTQYNAYSDALGRAELTFNEPSDNGIQALMGSFFDAWHDVANDPESPAARVALVHAASTLTSNIQRASNDLSTLRSDVNTSVTSLADAINSRASELSALNKQIVQVEANGDMANDLRDRRDVLLDQLSGLGQISYSETANHSVTVYLGSHELVSPSGYQTVQAINDPNPANAGMQKLVFTSDGTDVTSTSGTLRGLMDARDTAIPAIQAKLDALASDLITKVNALHSAGYDLNGNTGVNFFTGTDAKDIALNTALSADPSKIAASTDPAAVGNSTNALAIADLQTTASAGLGGATLDQYYASIVSVLGSDVAQAQGMAQSNGLLNSHVEAQRQGVSGVNIDEEVTNMTASQRAYEAAAKVISVIDGMLDTLINRTGQG